MCEDKAKNRELFLTELLDFFDPLDSLQMLYPVQT